MTNAHVVAGISQPRVDTAGGKAFAATVVAFDVTNDLAVLRVPGLGAGALPLAEPERGAPVALVGYPRNGPLTRTPGTARWNRERPESRRVRARPGETPGDRDPWRRRARQLGRSGIDAQGRVRTTVFARRPRETGGYGIPADHVRKALAQVGSRPVGATDCAP